MTLYDGALTVWSKSGGAWGRRVLSPARLEDGAAWGDPAIGPAPGSSDGTALRAYLPGAPAIAEGEYVAPGVVGDAEPPDGARRVAAVRALTLHGRPHHVEVTAR